MDRVPDQVPERVLEGVSDQVPEANVVCFFPVTLEKCELDLGNHKT
jgi:hypothetical protein